MNQGIEHYNKNLSREWEALLFESQDALDNFHHSNTKQNFHALYSSLGALDSYHKKCGQFFLEKYQGLEESGQLNGFFVNLFENSPVGYLVANTEGIILNSNATAEKMWNIKKEQFETLGLMNIIHPDFKTNLFSAMTSCKLSQETKTADLKCIRYDRTHFWGRLKICQIKETQYLKEPILLISISDITADRLLKDTVKKSAMTFTASTGRYFFSQLGRFLVDYPAIDHAFISELNDSKNIFNSLALSSNNKDIISISYEAKDNLKNFDKFNARGLVNVRSEDIEEINRQLGSVDGVRIYLFDSNRNIMGEIGIFSNRPIEDIELYSSVLKVIGSRAEAEMRRFKIDEELKQYQGQLEEVVSKRTAELEVKNDLLAQEIEKRKRTEANLRSAITDAEMAVRVKSAFLANMSHEIRTPLNGIIGVTSLLDRLKLSKKLKEYVGIVKQSGETLLYIVNDILDVSKLESNTISLEKEKFDLRSLFSIICSSHSSKFESKSLDFFLDYPYGLPQWIISDSVRLRQVIDNLLANAIKFTKTGSVVVKVRFSSDLKQLEFSIIDSGIGIQADQIDNIFERFTQADTSTTRNYGGTGLGLSISSKIIELFGGVLSCESEVDVGSKFTAKLPVSIDPSEPPFVPPFSNDVAVLLDVDDENVASGVEEGLDSLNIKVVNNLKEVKKFNEVEKLFVITNKSSFDLSNKENLEKIETRILFMGVGDNNNEDDKKINIQKSYLIESFLEEIIPLSDQAQKINSSLTAKIKKTVKNNENYDIHVLLAEDNKVNQIIAVGLLEIFGAHVDIASNGREAVELYQQKPYDVVLMDCLMPVMDGFEALSRIRILDRTEQKSESSPPIIAVTANAMAGDKEKCLAEGFDDYISKPIKLEELERVILNITSKLARN